MAGGGGVAITGGVGGWLAGLWLAGWADGHVIAITGTKGKSSTTAIAGHLLTRLATRLTTATSAGPVPPGPGPGGPAPRYWVIEVSSYQAWNCRYPAGHRGHPAAPRSPAWHGGVEQYYADKRPGLLAARRRGHRGERRQRPACTNGPALLGPRVEWVSADNDPGADLDGPARPARCAQRPNRALIARACLRATGVPEASDDDALRSAAAGFTRWPAAPGHRHGERRDVRRRSLSTNVLPTLPRSGQIPAGGFALIAAVTTRHRLRPLAAGLHGRDVPLLVLALDEAGRGSRRRSRRSWAWQGRGDREPRPGPRWSAGLGVGPAGRRGARSPAAASFAGTFRNYADRAAAFGRAMRACTDGDPAPVGIGHGRPRAAAGPAPRPGRGAGREPL